MPGPSAQLLTSILRDVSRSFYLTVRILPRRVRRQIATAYLLARTSDTIADTEMVPVERRLQALEGFRGRVLGLDSGHFELRDLAQHQGSPGESALLARCEETLGLLETFEPADLRLIRQVLATITGGQELDLKRFHGASAERIVALRSEEELDDYTYRVAGCVGEFWTRMCRAHLFPKDRLDDVDLLAKGLRFGKGLQLVNVLRDVPRDLRQGRCYLPSERLKTLGLDAQQLLDPGNEPKLRPLYKKYLGWAEGHLREGWAYTNLIPYRCARVRLACAWPVLLGFETLHLLRSGNVLDPGTRLKVSRGRVKRMIAASILFYPVPGLWRSLAGKQVQIESP